MANKVVDESPLGLEITSLAKRYKEVNALGSRRADTELYRTALRIAKARQKWEKDPFMIGMPFFGQFYIGFMKKKCAIFQVEDDKWCGSYVPWNKFYGDTVEQVLKEMLGIKW